MVRRLARTLRRRGGFTLIELLVVVAILALLAAIAAPKINDVIRKSKDGRAVADLKVISGALERYYNDYGKYPTKLEELWDGGYIKRQTTFQNAWGKYYFYAVDTNNGSPGAYALIDPGRTPKKWSGDGSAATPYQATLKEGESGDGTVPEGMPPTAGAWCFGGISECVSAVDSDGNEYNTLLMKDSSNPINRNSLNKYTSGAVTYPVYRPDTITE